MFLLATHKLLHVLAAPEVRTIETHSCFVHTGVTPEYDGLWTGSKVPLSPLWLHPSHKPLQAHCGAKQCVSQKHLTDPEICKAVFLTIRAVAKRALLVPPLQLRNQFFRTLCARCTRTHAWKSKNAARENTHLWLVRSRALISPCALAAHSECL